MKILILSLLFAGHSWSQGLHEVPFYFAVPEKSQLKLTDASWDFVQVKGTRSDEASLRAYNIQDPFALARDDEGSPKVALTKPAVVKQKRELRRTQIQKLFTKGLLQTGDIILTFRPDWEHTIVYSHVQMGISHTGMAYVKNGSIRNFDMPLDSFHNGADLESQFNSDHYLESDAFHIVRPRNFSAEKQIKLLTWIETIKKNIPEVRKKKIFGFNVNYMSPRIDKDGKGYDFVTNMARTYTNRASEAMRVFCSEFVWALLSLSQCSPDDPQIADPKISGAKCVKPIFNPLPMLSADAKNVGLAEGPLAVLRSLDIPIYEKDQLMKEMFNEGDLARLSSGHRKLAEEGMIKTFANLLIAIYPTKLHGMGSAITPAMKGLNALSGRNYSPTSFLLNTMLETADPERSFDYVATVIYADKL
jgi:hypothetical protein